MDERELEEILFLLTDRKAVLNSYLELLNNCLQDDLLSDERVQLEDERDMIQYEIREVELDIGAYTEMKNRLCFSEIGACGFLCDGRCPQCGGDESYNPLYEVFTGGDY